MSDVNRERRKARLGRHRRVRKKVYGTAERPRLAVYRSLNHIYAQIIDDDAARTIVSASSLKAEPAPERTEDEGGKKSRRDSIKMRRARTVGKQIAEAALEKGIKTVAFDRGGYLYHGRVAELAEAARKTGLEF